MASGNSLGFSGALRAENGLKGTLSGPVVRGYSAYDLAVKHGYRGTEAEWLEAIKGDQIELQVSSGILQWKYSKDTTWSDLYDLNEMVVTQASAYRIVEELPSEDDIEDGVFYILKEQIEDG